MGDEKTSTLVAALQLDECPLNNQFMYIEELNNACGSFILSSVIKHQIERNLNIIFVMCHNSIGHFHSISQKLGYNLISLKNSGRVYCIDILEKITDENFLISKKSLRLLYNEIKNQVDNWGNDQGVCIIVENLGNLLLADFEELFTFISYLRVIALERNDSSLVASMHNFPNCSNFSHITKSIRHYADVTVFLNDLQTGRANDVTGFLVVSKKEEDFTTSIAEYQYQLQDKSIIVFTPGSRNLI